MQNVMNDAQQDPLVSICCITYNHEKYIGEAIEGFLMQKIDFSIEIIIHDDASTDQTSDIIKEYQLRYPHLIFPVYQSQNQYSQGIKPSPTYVWPKARGKYIALCEGDDYWTNTLKLQRQVDFLEQHSDCAICYHRVEELNENDGSLRIEKLNTDEEEKTFTICDLANKNLMHTPSVVYRRENYSLPDWFARCPVGDYPLHMLNARYGKIKYFPQPMAVYRIHEDSTWSSQTHIYRVNRWLKVIICLIEEFKNESEIKNILLQQLLTSYRALYLYCINNNDMVMLKSTTEEILCSSPEFVGLWYDNFYKNHVKLASDYPFGVKKSAKHFIKQVVARLKNEN